MAAIIWDEIQISLGTLATETAVQVASRIDAARLQGFRLLRTEYFIRAKGLTGADDPIVVGLNHDLTVTEVKECINADPQRSGDTTADAASRTKRPVWPFEVFGVYADGNGESVAKGVAKIGWSAPEGTTFNWFVYNFGSGPLTTGGIVDIIAKHFGVWLKD